MERLSQNGAKLVNMHELHEAMGFGTNRNNDLLATLMRAGYVRWQEDPLGTQGYLFTPPPS